MSVRRACAVGRATAMVALLVGSALLLAGTSASAGDDPEALLEQARRASTTSNVAGVVEIRWIEGEQVFVERVQARSRGDAYVVGRGDNVAVGRDGVRYAADDGVATRWGRGPMRAAPAPSAAWDLELDDPATVAGRRTNVVAVRGDDGTLRARFFVDPKTHLLLRRDVFDRDGTLTRSVRFVRLSTGAAPPVPPVPEGSPTVAATDEVPDGFVAPAELGSFRLLGRYEHPDGTLQLFYGDGLFSLSVFEQDGLVDWGSVPEGGRRTSVEGRRAQTYSTAAGTVAVWGEGGLVLTCISDAPVDAVQAVLPGIVSDDTSGFDDVVDFVFGPFGWK
jgi:hypothetical protein